MSEVKLYPELDCPLQRVREAVSASHLRIPVLERRDDEKVGPRAVYPRKVLDGITDLEILQPQETAILYPECGIFGVVVVPVIIKPRL